MNKNFIVITSIFEPTKAVVRFSKMNNYQLIVVGDKKSPTSWNQENVIYLSVENQLALDYPILTKLPYNHYCRKMIGYLYAMEHGADIIIDTDDDNIPYEDWDFPSYEGEFETVGKDAGFVNIYKEFTVNKIWPRGLPLKDILKEKDLKKENSFSKIAVWQGLADGDPDVDAIYRLTSNELCNFDKRNPIVLEKGTICPYNSQNTATIKDFFALLYLPSFVTFRFTDILRGIVAQPILWAKGYRLGFTEATVVQERNEHDFMRDFESEIPMYLHIEKTYEIANNTADPELSVEENLLAIYKGLEKEGIVESREIELLRLWIQSIQSI
jgi:glycosyltransferase involved in cell wall biosynthesis